MKETAGRDSLAKDVSKRTRVSTLQTEAAVKGLTCQRTKGRVK